MFLHRQVAENTSSARACRIERRCACGVCWILGVDGQSHTLPSGWFNEKQITPAKAAANYRKQSRSKHTLHALQMRWMPRIEIGVGVMDLAQVGRKSHRVVVIDAEFGV